tara:strand:- start:568 stop:777 length:210 start_codon:yes stop_codon:yes gene_type:complete
MSCSGNMKVKFIKKYPTKSGWRDIGYNGTYNVKATIKAMNLVMQGYAKLIHSCKKCNPYHLDINLRDFK